MSSPFSWDESQIHAYVDGALDAEASARLEADSRADAALAARIEEQRTLRALLRSEFDPVLAEPIPQRLLDALADSGSGSVTPIGAARKASIPAARPRWSLREWGAIAATLVLGVLVGQLVRGPGSLPVQTRDGRVVAVGYLDAALSTQVAGTAAEDARARIGLSFRAAAGEYCRTFTLRTGADGLACRREGRWSVEVLDAAAARPVAPGGFRQASSALSPAVLGASTALGAGDPLSAEEERQRVESGWDSAGP